MYIPRKFAMDDAAVTEVLSAGGLVHLVTPGSQGLSVTPLPMVFNADRGILLGHMARANPHWRQCASGVESVAIIPGPQAYVSPSFYPTKAETGKVVPTWNYEIVTVYGEVIVHDDATWLHAQVSELTATHESGRERPWAVDDAPADFVEAQLRAIVGLEMVIDRWEGKSKLSQNQPDRNRDGVIGGLTASSSASDNAVARRMKATEAP